MKRLVLSIAILIASIAASLAQNVTVIGPITPGDCTMFNSTTIVKDGGFLCPGSGGTLNIGSITTVSGNTVLTNTSIAIQTVLCNAGGGPVSITLPAFPSPTFFKIKKIDSTINACIVVAPTGNIDNLPFVTITAQNTTYNFQANSSQWWLF